MELNAPLAQTNGPALPHAAAAQPQPPPAIAVAPPTQGAVQPTPAPPARRNRNPRGPVPPAPSSTITSAPALLELPAANPMQTDQSRSVNHFVPDAQMLFHVLSVCDQMMNSTDRFLRASPAWIPIVSQLYISVLWNVMILKVYLNSGYGAQFANFVDQLTTYLRIDECMIPGPLVPFFQALAAINGPYDWIGDLVPALPNFEALWDSDNYCPQPSYARMVPIPAIILDQLLYFSQRPIPANAPAYSDFQWYRNVFTTTLANMNRLNRIGPQLCGSLFTTQAQFDAARTFWNAALAQGITRTTTAAGNQPYINYAQLFGLQSQTGASQTNWFTCTATVMQKYAQYFNGSAPLKAVLTTGIGAVAVYGSPRCNTATRNWIYPPANQIEPFASNRFAPLRELPNDLAITFRHADVELEEQAEQYAMLTHTNIKWLNTIATQNDWTQIDVANTHFGDYWDLRTFRTSAGLQYKAQYAQIVASRYHQQAANRAT